MLLLFYSLFIFSVIHSGNSASISTLMDLPLSLPKGSYKIHATLTDKDTGDIYSMLEFISSRSTINGEIVVDTPKNKFSVYHYTKNEKAWDSYERQVIMGTDCLLYKFKPSDEFKLLPGVTKRLTSMLIAMGPSILYRLRHNSIYWKEAADENVRGTMMKSLRANINNKLNITCYYKSNLDQESGLQAPSRITFSGSDPSSVLFLTKENLILDIFSQGMDSTKDLSRTVKPLPGVGCSAFYGNSVPTPTMNSHLVHLILSETITSSTTTKTVSEIYANDRLKLVRIQKPNSKSEALYDYSLGLVYQFQEGESCKVSPVKRGSIGLSQETGQFHLTRLFLLDGNYKYLGKMYLENRPEFAAKVWESISYNSTVNSDKYDKVVTTQYFTETVDNYGFDGHLIVATIINCYNKDTSNGKYKLIQAIKRDYSDFQVAETESEFQDKFSVAECKDFTSEMTLSIHLECKEPDCIKLAEEHVLLLKERVKEAIFWNYEISALRLKEMDVSFSTSRIDLMIDFLEAPNILDALSPKTYRVNYDTLKTLSRTRAASELECLNQLSNDFSDFDVVLFCPGVNICGTIKGIENVEEDAEKGHACQVFEIPLHNLNRMMREISNKDLQSHLLRDTAYKTISLTNGYTTYFKYKMVDVLDVTRDKTDHSNDMFYLIHANEILKADDPNVVVVPNVKTFADCYRACKNSDELNCRTLSYCSGDKTNECLVTNMVPSAAPIDEFENNPKCGIFTENPVLHYTVNRNRRFKSQSSLSEELWLYQCASKCGSDNRCHSFQICGSTCTLNEAYTDTATEYSDTCDIYIPKVANEYFATGHKLVTEVFHTEYNINHDQCAALCFSRIGGTEPCQSFNFCPKGRSTSTCSLSKFSVKDSKTKTHEEKSCLNYGLIDPFRHEHSSPVINVKKGTSGSAAFVIILFFLATGFLFGIGIPIAYSKIKILTIRSGQSSNDNYAWTRQMDEQPLN